MKHRKETPLRVECGAASRGDHRGTAKAGRGWGSRKQDATSEKQEKKNSFTISGIKASSMTHIAPSAGGEQKQRAPESNNDCAFGHFKKSST